MGVLDDAIREHLELKRKHGAPQGEVAQQEQEALGAPRGRSAESVEAAAPEQVAERPATEREEPTAPEPISEVEVADPAPESVEASPAAAESEPAPPEAQTEEPQDDEPDWDFEVEPAGDERPDSGDTPPRGFERVVDDAPAADDEEDVLEETPDFLQETPEHDRLWFEQKPPRDFDFDDEK